MTWILPLISMHPICMKVALFSTKPGKTGLSYTLQVAIPIMNVLEQFIKLTIEQALINPTFIIAYVKATVGPLQIAKIQILHKAFQQSVILLMHLC